MSYVNHSNGHLLHDGLQLSPFVACTPLLPLLSIACSALILISQYIYITIFDFEVCQINVDCIGSVLDRQRQCEKNLYRIYISCQHLRGEVPR